MKEKVQEIEDMKEWVKALETDNKVMAEKLEEKKKVVKGKEILAMSVQQQNEEVGQVKKPKVNVEKKSETNNGEKWKGSRHRWSSGRIYKVWWRNVTRSPA